MSLLFEASEQKKFDVRLEERHVRRGLVTVDDQRKVSDKLVDDSKEAIWITVAELENPQTKKKVHL